MASILYPVSNADEFLAETKNQGLDMEQLISALVHLGLDSYEWTGSLKGWKVFKFVDDTVIATNGILYCECLDRMRSFDPANWVY